jgi:cell division protein FtsB
MTSIQWWITTVVVALLVGLGSGWYIGHKIDVAAQVTAIKAQQKANQKLADDRVAAEQKVADDTHQQLVQAQMETTSLNAQLEELRKTNASLTDKIAHVQFHPPIRTVVVHGMPLQCPGSSVASAEFLQLYNQAAGLQPASPAPAAGNTSGMYQVPFPSLRPSIDWPSVRFLFDDRSGPVSRIIGEQEQRSRYLSAIA